MTIANIYAEIRDLCDANSTTLPDATLLRRVNAALEKYVGKLIRGDATWQFDDRNFTTFPIGTQDLVAGQQDYSFDVRFLAIKGVSVKDANGNYQALKPIDEDEIRSMGYDPETYFNSDGMPEYYDKLGESILLYPAPAAGSVTLTNGLKVHFQRTADLFTTDQATAGTKEPGFASPFHMILCWEAAIPYCMKHKKDRVALYEKKAMDMEKDLVAFYSRREKDVRTRIEPRKRADFR